MFCPVLCQTECTGLQSVSTVAPMSYGLVQPTRIGQKCHHPNDNGSANSVDTVKKFFGDERWKVLTMPSLFL